jgi:hypothetical protein
MNLNKTYRVHLSTEQGKVFQEKKIKRPLIPEILIPNANFTPNISHSDTITRLCQILSFYSPTVNKTVYIRETYLIYPNIGLLNICKYQSKKLNKIENRMSVVSRTSANRHQRRKIR